MEIVSSVCRKMECIKEVRARGASSPLFVPAEHRMDIYVGHEEVLHVTCTPGHLEELVVGMLITEGLIERSDAIRQLRISEDGRIARVILAESPGGKPAGAEGRNICAAEGRPRIRPIEWQPEWLRNIAARMGREEPLYSATHAVHACYLAEGNRILCCREDIGRHNALDKVVGWAARESADLSRCILFTTGRLPADMVLKAIRCGIPLMASKTFPTDQGIAAARGAGLTLITLRPDGTLLVWTEGNGRPET